MGTHEKGVGARLRRMLAEHEQKAAAIRLTLDLLGVEVKAAKMNGHASVLADAIALDSARTGKTRRGRKPKQSHAAKVRAQRERSAAALAAFSTTTPREGAEVTQELGIPSRALGSLVRRGYLKRTRGGEYLRTAKGYTIEV